MIEDKIWSSNPSTYIIGSDEVGRGSFAGPIGAASVRINYEHIDLLLDVKDSKKLSVSLVGVTQTKFPLSLLSEYKLPVELLKYTSCSSKTIDNFF